MTAINKTAARRRTWPFPLAEVVVGRAQPARRLDPDSSGAVDSDALTGDSSLARDGDLRPCSYTVIWNEAKKAWVLAASALPVSPPTPIP